MEQPTTIHVRTATHSKTPKRSNPQQKTPKQSNKLDKMERTEQANGKRSEWEQQTVKERVSKEYERALIGVTCRTFRREVPESLPDWLKERRMENDLPAYSQFEVLFLTTDKRSLNRASLAKSRRVKRIPVRKRIEERSLFYPSPVNIVV